MARDAGLETNGAAGGEPKAAAQPQAAAAVMGLASAPQGYLPSQRHAHFTMGAAVALLVVTLVVCFGLWLEQGCRGFLPFISDLGLYGAMRPVFAAGLVGTSLAMFAALPHIVVARHHLVLALELPRRWEMANWVVAMAGGAVSLGVGLLGFFPWDRALVPHLLCADVIFGGGVAWAIGSCVLAWRFARAAESETWQPCPRTRKAQVALAAACICDLLAAYVCFAGAYLSDPGLFDAGQLEATLRLANDEFGAYCTGRKGWHGLAWINLAALGEWLLVAFMVASVVTAAADLEAHCIVQRGLVSRNRPFLEGGDP